MAYLTTLAYDHFSQTRLLSFTKTASDVYQTFLKSSDIKLFRVPLTQDIKFP